MKRYGIILLALIAVLSLGCERCIQCEIYGHSIDDSILVDNDTIVYQEFCGSKSEVEAFENDVIYHTENRSCVVYNIIKASNNDTLATFKMCSGIREVENFKTYLVDSIINVTYVNEEVFLELDGVIENPGTYQCK